MTAATKGPSTALDALRKLQDRLSTFERRAAEPIAIVGMGCRFPGADSPEAFWALLTEGRDAITEVPAGRWDGVPVAPAYQGVPVPRWGGFLPDVWRFDSSYFGVSPREALSMDPQQRLVLEVATEAIFDAGLTARDLAASRTGVFVGVGAPEYAQQVVGSESDAATYLATGNALSIVANRLSFLLNLTGPSVSIDTACSSSLVALHLGCQSLRAGESEICLVGGVNLLLLPYASLSLNQLNALSPDGRCKTFDASANGYVRSEGCGIVVLKRLSDAQRDGDRVLAVVRGSAVAQDGASTNLTAPSGVAQERLIRSALANARTKPEEVAYVEAHGTGTSLGDPVEVVALGKVFGEQRSEPLLLGAVKSNIGHLESAAGIAGVIKTVLAIQHGRIPANLHFGAPNPHIPFAELPFQVVASSSSWPASEGPRVAGVSSFGFGGTIAHAVLSTPPPAPQTTKEARHGGPAILPISARTPAALQRLAGRFAETLANVASDDAFRDVVYTAARRRDHREHRLAIVSETAADAAARLAAWAAGSAPSFATGTAPDHRAPLAFVFAGQGSQSARMAMSVFDREPAFRDALEACAALVSDEAGWSLLDVLRSSGKELDETRYAQPALFAVEIALAALWRSWGIVPDAVVGHSLGEVAAAHVAGVLDLATAVRLVVRRGLVMQKATGRGRMAQVALPFTEARELAARSGGKVAVAASNGPRASVLSGESVALTALLDELSKANVRTKLLPVDYAFHSSQMDELVAELEVALAGLRTGPSVCTIMSTVTGAEIKGEALDARYWARQMREPVLFAPAVTALLTEGFGAFLEVGPHPVLGGSISETAESIGQSPLVASSLRRDRDDVAHLRENVALLHCAGQTIDFAALDTVRGNVVALPSYPWEPTHYRLEGTLAVPAPSAGSAKAAELEAPAPTGSLASRLREAPEPARLPLVRDAVMVETRRVLGIPASTPIPPGDGFFKLGMDSVMSVELSRRLTAALGVKLPATVAFDYPNVELLTRHVLASISGDPATHAATRKAGADEPIAIVGMGCRFPGGATTPEAYWDLLREGRLTVREVPQDRWDVEAYYDPDPENPGTAYTRSASFIDDVASFDSSFFGIAPREANAMDPQQRLLLEVAWEALERAGIPESALAASRTGVFVGLSANDYVLLNDDASVDAYTAVGISPSVAAGRISYVLGLNGPALTIDTACSSSVVGLHLACRSLRDGECDLALAGGALLILSPRSMVALCKMRACATDGRCKTFDADANGYGRGEGAGVLVLKRLSDALAARDPIIAVVRGTAVNQDGASSGLTVPNGPAQQAVIRDALAQAGIKPGDVGYLEAHGTGTPLGDPIEVRAAAAALGQGRHADTPLVVGSAKANLGHLEAAAGVAGLMKVALGLQHQEIPPHVGMSTPNPAIPWSELPIVVPRERMSWPAIEGHRVGGISSFGFSGTNAHAILEEAPPSTPIGERPSRSHEILCLSAKSEKALHAAAERAAEYLREHAGETDLTDICFTAAVRRTHHRHRLALVGSEKAELAERLARFARGEDVPLVRGSATDSARKVVFVFPGQGSQWVGMGRELFATEPTFRAAIERCDAAIKPFAGWSLIEELHAPSETSRLNEIDVIQPLIFSMQVGLSTLWETRGVHPDAVVGHSMGEVAAAAVAGVISLSDAARIICTRSLLLRRFRGLGAAAVVELSHEQATAAIAPYDGRVSVAAINSPRSSLLSGDKDDVAELVKKLDAQGTFARLIRVDVASHSHVLEPLRDDLLEALAPVRPQAPRLTWLSTVTDEQGTPPADAQYWWRNLREPVRLAPRVDQLISDGHYVFVEVSPHPVLAVALGECLAERKVGPETGRVVATLRREQSETASFSEALASLHCAGFPIPWERHYPSGRVVPLPTYPWQRQRHWLAAPSSPTARRTRGARGELHGPAHPLLARYVEVDTGPVHLHVWESDVASRPLEALTERAVRGVVVLPTATSLEILLAAAFEASASGPVNLTDVTFEREPTLASITTLQVSIATPSDRLTLSSRGGSTWTQRASATLAPAKGSLTLPSAERLRAEAAEELGEAEVYARLRTHDMVFGDRLRAIRSAFVSPGRAVVELELPNELAREGSRYLVHPALLDAALNAALLAASDDLDPASRYRVAQIARVRVEGPASSVCTVQVRTTRTDGAITFDLAVHRADGAPVASFEGVSLVRQFDHWMYRVAWSATAEDASKTSTNAVGPNWLLTGHTGSVATELARELRAAGAAEVDVRPLDGQVVRDLLAATQSSLNVVYFADVDAQETRELTRGTLDSAASDAFSVIELANAAAASNANARLVVFTRGAEAGDVDGPVSRVEQSLLWGLGRTISLEYPGLGCKLVDLPPDGDAAELARRALAELSRADDLEEHVLLRGTGARLVARLSRDADPPARTAKIEPGGAYLVTGGLGGIGRLVARWMARQGAGHLFLLGRSAANEELPEVTALGARVHVLRGDVADEARMREVFAEIERHAPLRGIIHAAGSNQPTVLKEMTREAFDRILRPKVAGTWVLDQLTRGRTLDFFLSFSSISSIWGSGMLGHYAAANQFLNAFSVDRRSRGLAATSIAWGGWRESGLMTDEERDFTERMGVRMMFPEDALAVMGSLLGEVNRVVSPMDWSTFKPLLEVRRTRPLLALVGEAAAETTASSGELRDALATMHATDRVGAIADFIRVHLTKVLGGSDAADLTDKGFFEVGMDSLMALDLKRRLEAALRVQLPATIAFEHPSIKALSRYLASDVLSFDDDTNATATVSAPTPPKAKAEEKPLGEPEAPEALTQMDDDALAKLLAAELEGLDP